ncbi:guanine nucleotide-binding protein-like 1 [Penaeus japonicus]|uniref:guanine nucleotide-binding protein-like 1 n=1 Tax=Penaeus japonicus TaxID=27405 RepID=UPI001C7114B7|nr:guanine nucleotide-binding protein-like 1 [Penaeus japonicus]XP_042879049.1 guanine nucleotide-binding protein-like 1 [Penaeus japonicus]XP_042879050.1 guanine nucleotide-binding protein-like 1 [Penaeus japonicus]
MPNRGVAFSGKKKKKQLQAKREKKQTCFTEGHGFPKSQYSKASAVSEAVLTKVQEGMDNPESGSANYLEDVLAINLQPGGRGNVNRYNLKFRKQTPEEIEKRKALHYSPIKLVAEDEMELETEFFFPPGLDYPTRPEWKKNMSKQELDRSENKHFRLFCEKLDKEFSDKDLSLYELNLETWRQLWRVTEMSDILLIIVDARFPVSQFPPYLYHRLVEEENKGIILVLNKCDLVPPSIIVAWEHYFHHKFPKLLVVPFSSMEGYGHRRGMLKMAAEGSLRLVDACQKLIYDSVDLTPWKDKIEEERNIENEINQECEVEEVTEVVVNTRPEHHERYKDGVLTIGTIGYPNVGKSSLINALMGKKVVSVSRTPGHTKHFQTIFLTQNVKLCDCPGLVFPSTVSMHLQVLFGSFPIAQVRDPIGAVNYVATRLDIPGILKLQHSEVQTETDPDGSWTAFYICEAWAMKRGYFIKRRGAPDVSRSANELLRLCLNGHKSLVLFIRPPGYSQNKGNYEKDPRAEEIRQIQGVHARAREPSVEEPIFEEDEKEGNEPEESEDESEDDAEDSEDGEDSDDEEDEDEGCSAFVSNKFALLDSCD